MKQALSKERLEDIVNDPMINQGSEFAIMARALLAAHEQEPVGEVIEMRGGLIMDGVINLDSRTYREISGLNKMKRMPLGTKFYTHPAPVPAVPDELRSSLQELVKAMRDYEMDVDEPAPYKHREMMRRAEALLNGGKS